MYAYILSQVEDVDNSDGYWDDPSVTTRRVCVGVTLSREYASNWIGSEIGRGTTVCVVGDKSVVREIMLPS